MTKSKELGLCLPFFSSSVSIEKGLIQVTLRQRMEADLRLSKFLTSTLRALEGSVDGF